ncbi:hypothetical protein BDZ89DRAFT_1033670 [Hymenopellis radicata]|nr:hypothetical protein BDZ89DRAFT_1033670 [Hymenopellis radicata]
MILNAIVTKFNEVITNSTSTVEDDCFDSWMDDLPVEVSDLVRKFRDEIRELKKVEAKKNEMYNKAMERKRKEEKSTSNSKLVPVEVWHLRFDKPGIYPVRGCTTQDTFDVVLLQWIFTDKTISLRSNPHFYDNLEGWMSQRALMPRDALKFSAILPQSPGKAHIIIHCVTDYHEYPLIIFKHIPGWTFAQLWYFWPTNEG